MLDHPRVLLLTTAVYNHELVVLDQALVDSKGGHHTAATSRQLSDASSIAPEKAPVRRTSGSDSSERDSWDIFEPRMEQQAPPAQPTDTAANGAANGAVKVDLKALKLMTGAMLYSQDHALVMISDLISSQALPWQGSSLL